MAFTKAILLSMLVTMMLFGWCMQPAEASTVTETLKVTASDGMAQDALGDSAALDGTIAVVGAASNDAAGDQAGAAYVYDVTTGTELYKLTASDAAAGDLFGISASLSGATTIIGADSNDDAGSNSGSAYLFNVNTGAESFKLTASDAADGDRFGAAVGIDGATAIVGAPFDDDTASNSGSAYLFDTATGNQLHKLHASDAQASDAFGSAVAISGTTAIVGARYDDDGGDNAGAAYLFDTTTGNQLFKLTASDPTAGAQYGQAVAISGDRAVVGAWLSSHGAGGPSGAAYVYDTLTGNELFRLAPSGADAITSFGFAIDISGDYALISSWGYDEAYLFDLTTGAELYKLVASDPPAGGQWAAFGNSVGLSGNWALVGANRDDDLGFSSGSAYVYDLSAVPLPSAAWAGLALLAGLAGARRVRGRLS